MNRNRPRKLTAAQRRNIAQIVGRSGADHDEARALTTYTARAFYRADA